MKKPKRQRRRGCDRRPCGKVRVIYRDRLPGGIFRWELRINNEGGWNWFYRHRHIYDAQMAEIRDLLKRSAGGRWKLVRDRRFGVRKVLLERDSDVILVKLFNFDPVFRVYKIELTRA